MSKFKNEDLLRINAGLVYLSGANTDAWMKISRNIKKIKPVLISFQESHQEIIGKYAKKPSNGETITNENIDFGKNTALANDAWDALNKEEVAIEFISIPDSEITKNGDKCPLDAVSIEPLLDIIITDG